MILAVIILVVVGVVSGGGDDDKKTASDAAAVGGGDSTTSVPDSTAPPTTATPDPAPIKLTGRAQQVSKITVTAGLVVLTSTHPGAGNFAIEVLDATGGTKEIPVNVIGAYSGSVGENLASGDYQLKVTASTPWTIMVTQPRNQQGKPLPIAETGKQQQIIGPFACGRSVKIEASNTGQGNFALEVLDRNGSLEDVAVNEIGSYEGSTIANGLAGGPCWVNVTSEGTWKVSLSSL